MIKIEAKILILFIYLAIQIPSYGQTIKGIILDADSGVPLPYAHVGIKDLKTGGISKEDGTFELNISNDNSDKIVQFSHLGYKQKSIPIKKFFNGSQIVVKLEPSVFDLQEVVVISKTKKRQINIGRKKLSNATYGHNRSWEYGLGREWGLLIPFQGNEYSIESINFHTKFNTIDSVLFRVNVYKIENDLPGESLFTTENYVKSYSKDKWISADLKNTTLSIEEDVIVSFEIIRLWYSNKTNNDLFFSYSKESSPNTTFIRETSFDKWETSPQLNLACYMTVKEYIH